MFPSAFHFLPLSSPNEETTESYDVPGLLSHCVPQCNKMRIAGTSCFFES